MGFANKNRATVCNKSPRRGGMFIANSNPYYQNPVRGEIIMIIHLCKIQPAPLN